MPQQSIGEATLEYQLKAYKIPFEREFKFHPTRQWKFDFIITKPLVNHINIAIEVEGGVWGAKSRHRTGTGFLADMEKYNHAAFLGWMVFRFSTEQVTSGEAINFINKALADFIP